MLVEIIVRGDLLVANLLKILSVIGDIGAKVFLYYGNLELLLQRRRYIVVKLTAQLVSRVPKMEEF